MERETKHMSDYMRHGTVTIGSERGFGLLFAAVLALIGLSPLLVGAGPRAWALTAAAAFLFVGLAVPLLLRPFNLVWFRIGLLLGEVVSPVVMFVIFVVAVVPTAFVVKLSGKDPLRLRFDRQARTYWSDRRREGPPVGSMRRQF
jgi:predicted membrane metal-binding protein